MISIAVCALVVLTLVETIPINRQLKMHTIQRTTELCSGNPCVGILSRFCPSDTNICTFSSRTCKVSCQPKALPGSVSTNKLSGHEGLFPEKTLFDLLFPDQHNTMTRDSSSSSNNRNQKTETSSASKKLLNQTHGTQPDSGGVGTRVGAIVG